jgi:hypothetical protein
MNTKSIVLIKAIGVGLILISLYTIGMYSSNFWQRELVTASYFVMFIGIIMLSFTKTIIKNKTFSIIIISFNLLGIFFDSKYKLVWQKGLAEIIGHHIFIIIGIIILIINNKWKKLQRMKEIEEMMKMYEENNDNKTGG